VVNSYEQFILPELSVKTLATSLDIRRAVLSARFQVAMGISPGAYINRTTSVKGELNVFRPWREDSARPPKSGWGLWRRRCSDR